MDRQKSKLVLTCGLGLVLAVSGCRSPRSEVPPGRQYMNDGRQVPSVGFSQEGRPAVESGFPNGAPGSMTGPASPTGLLPPSSSLPPTSSNNGAYGAPTDHGYGPPMTSSLVPQGSTNPGTPLPGSAESLGMTSPTASPSSGPGGAAPSGSRDPYTSPAAFGGVYSGPMNGPSGGR